RRRDAGGPGPATARAAQQGKPPTAISGSGATTMGRMTRPPAAVRHPNPSKGRVPSFCDQSTVRLPSSFEDLLYHVAVAFLLGTAWTTAWPPASRVRQVLVRTERVAHRSVSDRVLALEVLHKRIDRRLGYPQPETEVSCAYRPMALQVRQHC